jgi:hypothetical protein
MWPFGLSFGKVRQTEISGHYSRTSNKSHNHMPTQSAFALLFVAIIGFLLWQSPGFVGVIRSEPAIAGKTGLLLGQASLSLCDMPSERAIGGKLGIFPLQSGLSLGEMPLEPPIGGKTGILSWQSGLFLAETNVFGANVVEPQSPSNLPKNSFALTPPIQVQTSWQLPFEVEAPSSSFDFPSWDASFLNQLPSFFLTRSDGFEPGGETPLGQIRPTDLKPPAPPGPPGVLGAPPSTFQKRRVGSLGCTPLPLL